MPRSHIALGTAIILLAGSAVAAIAAEKFVPKGHSYGPSADRLPVLNSTEDRINGRTDVIETEIYRSQRERAIWEAEMNRLIHHDFNAGTRFTPRY